METLKIGDPVWAKMKGFPSWPGIITQPPPEIRKKSSPSKPGLHSIFFFGSKNYAWIDEKNIKNYHKHKDEFIQNAKSALFKEACTEIEDFILTGGTVNNINSFFEKREKRLSLNKTPDSAKKAEDTSAKKVKSTPKRAKRLSSEEQPGMKTPRRNNFRSPVADQAPEKPVGRQQSFKDLNTKNTVSKQEKGGRYSLKLLADDNVPEKTVNRRQSFRGMVTKNTPSKEPEQEGRYSLKLSTVNNTEKAVTRRQSFMDSSPKKRVLSCEGRDSISALAGSSTVDTNIEQKSPFIFDCVSSDQRVPNIQWPESQPLYDDNISETTYSGDVPPSSLQFGFIGLGMMGSGILKNLLNSGHRVEIWNRSKEKCAEFEKAGATVALTPHDLVSSAEIIFCCVSDTEAVKNIFFGEEGVMAGIVKDKDKAYVEMSVIDNNTSNEIATALESVNARYLEVRFHGEKKEAEEGNLLLLASGDFSLYKDCESCFRSMSNHQVYYNKLGEAIKYHTLIQTAMAVTLTGLCEGLMLAGKCGLSQSDLMTVLRRSSMNCRLITEKCKAYDDKDDNYTAECSLDNLQKDIELALKFASDYDQPMGVISVANETFKRAKRLGYKDFDSYAVYLTGNSQS